MVQAKPALVEASALKPRCCSAFALPTSNGFGSTKQPEACILRKVARLSAVVTGMGVSFVALLEAQDSDAQRAAPAAHLVGYLAQKRSLLGEDEFVLLGEIEISHALGIAAQPRAVVFVSTQALERDQREGDVVGAFMRHEIADQVAAAFRDDSEPA